MATIQQQYSVPANTTVASILAGSMWEFANMDQILNLGFVAGATGLLVDVFLNDQVIVQQLTPFIGATINTMPILPDNYPVTNEGMVAGDRLTIRVQNTTGAAINLNFAINITPA